jgi:hypothetical protein
MKRGLGRAGHGVTAVLGLLLCAPMSAQDAGEGARVQCANLVYAVNKTSVCFSDRFLQRLELETNVRTDSKFVKVQLDSNDIYKYPFSIMTGEGGFSLTPRERMQLKYYVSHGGFLLASAGCSDPEWTRSFRSEMGQIFPNQKLQAVPMNHPIYRTVYAIANVQTTHEQHKTHLEALTENGHIVVIFSPDGLNDTSHAENCCCCGGDEVDQAEYINVDILAYALFH